MESPIEAPDGLMETQPGESSAPYRPDKEKRKKKRKEVRESNEDDGEDTARPSKNNPHVFSDESSEEESSEDEEAMRKEFSGFIVDEPDEGEVDETQKRKRDEPSDEESEVDAEDLDLVAENTGAASSKRRKRLRRNRVVDDGEDADGEREDEPPRRRVEAPADDLADMFDDDGGGARRRGRDDSDEDDIGDFIEDDEPGLDGEPLDEEARAQRRQERRNRARAGTGEQGGASKEWLDMFDASEYAEAATRPTQPRRAADDDDGDAEEEAVREAVRKPAAKLADVYEPTIIREKMLTEDDEIVRATDVPERYQVRHRLGAYSVCGDPAEIQREAIYISFRMSTILNDPRYAEDPVTEAIGRVLSFIRDEEKMLLEVPFIATLRKDRWAGHLTREDLWTIADQDEQFQRVDSTLQSLIPLCELAKKWSYDAREDPVLDKIHERVESAVAADDVRRYIRLHYGDDILNGEQEARGAAAAQARPAPSRYQVLKAAGMAEVAKGFHVDIRLLLSGVVDALQAGQNAKRHYPEDEPLFPVDYFQRFVKAKTRFATAEVVMTSARTIVAEQIASDPELRMSIRRQLFAMGAVYVEPTDKGKSMISEKDPYYFFKYLRGKPITDFRDGQFASIVKAETDGLLKLSIRIGDAKTEDTIVRTVNYHIRSDGASDVAAAWNEQREKIATEALDVVLRDAVKWLRQEKLTEANEYIARKASETLEQRLMRAPFEPRKKGDEDGDDEDERRDPGISVLDGQLRGVMQMNHLQDRPIEGQIAKAKKDDLVSFVDLVGRFKPDVVVVAGESVSTAGLFTTLQSEVAEENNGLPRRARPPVIYGLDDVARIWRGSKDARVEFPEYADMVRYCVAVGRSMQDPLMGYASLFDREGSILRIQLHPQQNAVPSELLLKHLERAFMNVVSIVGVDINQAVRYQHLSHTLQFVSGLGPRKALGIQMKARQLPKGQVTSRQQLVVDEESGMRIMGARVFHNCASFLRIRTYHFTQNVALDVLDDTRIHPEDYDLARKMASDAMDADDLDEEEENPSRHVEELMDGNQRRLDDLLLDDYAEELAKRIGEPKRLLLLDMKQELQEPYGERRKFFFAESPNMSESTAKPTHEDEVFTMLTGETDETFWPGMVSQAIVERILPPREEGQSGIAIVGFGNGLESRVTPRDFPMASQYAKITEVTSQGDALTVKIKAFNKAMLKVEISVVDKSEFAPKRDAAFDHDRERADKEKRLRDIAKAEAENARADISHPQYHRDWGVQESQDYLLDKEIGTLIVRPSSTPGNVVAVIKWDTDTYWHVSIQRRPGQNGRDQWTIKDSGKTFESLDHLITIYFEPMMEKAREIRRNSKFSRGRLPQVTKELTDHLIRTPSRSAYAFCAADGPGYFYLVYKFTINSAVEHERVFLGPGSFKFREIQFNTADELLNYFKTNPRRRPLPVGGAATGQRIPMSQYGTRPGTAYGATPAMRTGQMAGYASAYGGQPMAFPAATPMVGVRPMTPYGAPPVQAGAATPGYVGWAPQAAAPQPPIRR